MTTIARRLLLAVAVLLPALCASAHAAHPLGQITEFATDLPPINNILGSGDGADQDTATGPDGNVWFTDARNGEVGRISPSGQITEFRAGLQARSEPHDIVAGPDGNLWFSDEADPPAIGRITPSGTITEFTKGLQTDGLVAGVLRDASSPDRLVAGADGNVWFVDFTGTDDFIGRITPSGQITEFKVPLVKDDFLSGGIAAGADGNVWFTTDDAIDRITPQGQITSFRVRLRPDPESAFDEPAAITAGPDGDMWFVYSTTNTDGVGRISPSGRMTAVPRAFLTPTAGSSGIATEDIATGPDGNLWVTDNGVLGPSIDRVTPNGGLTQFFTGLMALGSSHGGASAGPDGIEAGPGGDMWFMDNGVTVAAIGRIGTRPGGPPPKRAVTRVVTCPAVFKLTPRCSVNLAGRAVTSTTTATLVSEDEPTARARGTARVVGNRLLISLTSERGVFGEDTYRLTLQHGHTIRHAHIKLA